MTDIIALVRAWLTDNLSVASEVDDRVSTVLDPHDGFPAIVIGPVTGSPRTNATYGVDCVEDWQVALYCYGGRINAGKSDLPDTAAAHRVASAITAAAASITASRFTDGDASIVAASVVSAAPSAVDPDTGSSRATVTLSLQVWN